MPCAPWGEGGEARAFEKQSNSFLSFVVLVSGAVASESEKSDESKDSLEKDVYINLHANNLLFGRCSSNKLRKEVVQHNLLQYPTLDIQVPPPKIG